jgi:hypothetical protein
VGNWRVGYGAGWGPVRSDGSGGKTYKLDHARSRGDNNDKGHNYLRGRGGRGGLSKLHFSMEEHETGLSGLG